MMNEWQSIRLEKKEPNQWVKCWNQTPHWHHSIWNVRKKGKGERKKWRMNDRQWDWRWRSQINEWNAEIKHRIDITGSELWGRRENRERETKEMMNEWQAIILELKEQNHWVKCWSQTPHWHHWVCVVRKKGKQRKRNERNDEWMTGNNIGDEGEKMVRESWGTRDGGLYLW